MTYSAHEKSAWLKFNLTLTSEINKKEQKNKGGFRQQVAMRGYGMDIRLYQLTLVCACIYNILAKELTYICFKIVCNAHMFYFNIDYWKYYLW